MDVLGWIMGLMAAVLMGFTVIVGLRYWWGWHRIVKAGLADRHLLPLHVWVVAISYNCFLLGVVIQMSVLVRWWHPLVYLPGIALGFFAMVVMNKVGRLREMPPVPPEKGYVEKGHAE
jgi:hypothetical protein